jgi:hypothetical protein
VQGNAAAGECHCIGSAGAGTSVGPLSLERAAYNVWNVRGGVTRENWSVTPFVENLLHKKYYTNAYEKAFATGMFLEPSFRDVGVRLTVKTRWAWAGRRRR